ncbi:MAG: HNH endonuclease, partial [Candidatus Eremiobacteraeota bacterium]|nr:HNH endonuclease [Candidatus Eremiobacteraeota bacterium]
MSDYTMYWKPSVVDDNDDGTDVDHIGSNQPLSKLCRGDVVWILTSLRRKLRLVNRFEVWDVGDTAMAELELNRSDLWDAEWHAISKVGRPIRVIPLGRLTEELRFESEKDRLSVNDDGTVDIQQVRAMRRLSGESAKALADLWERGPLDPDKGEAYLPDGRDTRQRIERSILSRRGQTSFRQALLTAQKVCAVSGCGLVDILEAAHISPYRGEKDNHTTNGLLLRADIHTLFDLHLLGIEPETRVIQIHRNAQKDYG